MNRSIGDVEHVRQGISRAALAHNAQIEKLQRELQDAYVRELEMATVVAERRQFSQQLYTTRQKLDMYRRKFAVSEAELAVARRLLAEGGGHGNVSSLSMAEIQGKLNALSNSMLGSLQLKYWRLRQRLRRGRGNA